MKTRVSSRPSRQFPLLAFGFIASLGVLAFQKDSLLVREAQAQPLSDQSLKVDRTAPVDFEADNLTHDEATQIITATGNVELVQQDRILRADKMLYNLNTDTVKAEGNVILTEINGNTYFADEVEFTNNMKDGFVTGLKGLLSDGSRFTATQGRRVSGTRIVMRDADYTACEPCKENPDADPPWQLVASEVTHDDVDNRISYEDARLEMWGVPVFYTPYFSHPDGSVKRKSGFLPPSVGFDSELGAMYQQEYYWAMAPDKDATFGVLASTEEAPLFLGEYRQRFENAEVQIENGITYSGRNDSEAGVNVEQDKKVRGHVFTDGLWNINEKWRSGLKVALTTDDQYARQYDITTEDVLENEIYIERFSGRDYIVGRLLGFQDIRVSSRQTDQPNIFPEIEASFLGEPNALMGGRWSAGLSALSLSRDGSGQDVTRTSGQLGWERRLVDRSGLVTTFNTTARGDAYNVRDRDVATFGSGRSTESSEVRGFVQAHAVTSYPLVKSFQKAQMVVEPTVALTAASNVEVDSDIPNEDSQDAQLESANLFEANRFPGYDRIEDRTRATYGVRTGVYGYGGGRGEVFLGQSYRFDSNDNPFPEGSGLSEESSDIVGEVTGAYGGRHEVNYRFRVDDESLSSQRHELDLKTGVGPLSLNTRYIFAKALQGTDITESREQLRVWTGYDINEDWRLYGSTRHDLGEDSGLRQATMGFNYTGQCVTFSATAQRNLTADSSGDSGTEIMFRIGLLTLGEFETSGLSIDDSDDEQDDEINEEVVTETGI